MTARYTPLDRVAVNLWLAQTALLTVERVLKRAEHRETIHLLLAEIEALRALLKRRDIRNWKAKQAEEEEADGVR